MHARERGTVLVCFRMEKESACRGIRGFTGHVFREIPRMVVFREREQDAVKDLSAMMDGPIS